MQQVACDVFYHFGRIQVVPFHYRDPLGGFRHIQDPSSEAGEGCGQGRNPEGDAFQGRVSPRFVIGGEYRSVEAYQQVVIAEVEDTVFAVQVAGYEDDFHLVFRTVLQPAEPEPVQNRVVGRVAQMVGAVGLFEFPSAVFLVQTASGLFVPGGNGQEGHYILLKLIPVVEQGKAVDKEVDAFVLEFVTAAVD